MLIVRVHRPGRRPLSLFTPLSLLMVLAMAVAGCGGGSGTASTRGPVSTEEASRPSASDGSSDAGKASEARASLPAASPHGQSGESLRQPNSGSKDGSEHHGGGEHHGSSHGAQGHHPGAGSDGGAGHAKGGRIGPGRCPGNITREQCEAYAEQPVSSAPTHPVEAPEECLKAMSREACEEQFENEKAGKEKAGQSVSVDHCLEEKTRAECEAQMGAQLEAERESKE